MIKAGMDGFNKSVILGAATHAMELIARDESYVILFESMGDHEKVKNKRLLINDDIPSTDEF